ncbi:MAG TPA: ATP-binding protein [Gaiellaceae bacterium]|nr:ATP-binding protein [Gaiellaceae bacterium]
MGVEQLNPLEELRRRERQQALVAELGRSALTGTELPELFDEALAAAADGLAGARVEFCEPTPETTEPLITERELAAPIRGPERPLTVLAAHSTEEQPFSPDDGLFLRALANLLAIAAGRERADERRRASEASLGLLAEAGHMLASTLDYQETLVSLAKLVVPSLADWFIVDVVDDEGQLQRVAVTAADPGKQELLEELALNYPPRPGSRQPAGLALERGATVHFPAFTPEELRETTYDDRHYEIMVALAPHSAIAVPLVAHDRTLGALTFAWSESARTYGDSDLTLAEEVARRAALAIDNARLYRAEQAARDRTTFLGEASNLLAGSLDYTETLASVARLAVPRMADWCLFYMLSEEGRIERVAVEHGGGRQDVVRAILAGHELKPDAPSGVPSVIRTGRSELHSDATPVSLASDVDQPEELAAALAEVEVHSTMCVPLIARGRTLGALLLVSAESARRFSEQDLALAEELASRAALAVDNSRLYREVEERAEAAHALATVADGVIFIDRQGTIRVWNAAAEMITGIPASSVRGRGASELFPGWEQIAEAVPANTPAQAPTASPRTMPVTIYGRELWLSISRVASAEGVVFAFRDVTEDQRLEQLKSDFVATVSHELRTPLAAVYGAAVTLADRDLSGRPDLQRALIAQIVDQTERLTSIVSDILLTSELEAGRFRLTPGEIDPVAVARAAVEAARLRLPDGAEIEFDASPGAGTVETDAGRLRQVLDNLIENAVKYAPGGGRTTVHVAAEETLVRFTIADSGVGIPAAELERIFEKFYRLDPEHTRGVAGTGLGLYVCKELVERMNGRVSVESAVGRGSTFTVELPRR